METRHLIKELVFDLTFDSTVASRRADAMLASWVSGELLPLIEPLFDELSGAGETIRLDLVEIDLGDVPYQGFEAEIATRLVRQLSEALRDKRAQLNDEPARRLADRNIDFDQLGEFLSSGNLPWQARANATQAHETLLERVLRQDCDNLIQHLSHSPVRGTLVKRLVRQFPEAHLVTLLRRMKFARGELLLDLIDTFRQALGGRPQHNGSRTERIDVLWEQVLEVLLATASTQDIGAVIATIVERYARSQAMNFDWTLAWLMTAATVLASENRIGAELKTLLASISRIGSMVRTGDRREPLIPPTGAHRLAERSGVVAYTGIGERAMATSSAGSAVGDPLQSVIPLEFEWMEQDGQAIAVTDDGANASALLHHRLAQGLLKGDVQEVTAIWDMLRYGQAGLVQQALRHYGKFPSVRAQLAAHFPDSILLDFTRLLEPGTQALFTYLIERSDLLNTDADPVLSNRSGNWKRRLWEYSLAHVLHTFEGPSVRFDSEAYITGLIRHMVESDANAGRGYLLERVRAAAQLWLNALTGTAPTALKASLSALSYADMHAAALQSQSPGGSGGDAIYESFLRRLREPLPMFEAAATLEAALDRLATLYPAHMRRLLGLFQRGELSLRAERLNSTQLRRLLAAQLALDSSFTPNDSNGNNNAAAFLQEIDAQSRLADDRVVYFRSVLERVLQRKQINLSEILSHGKRADEKGKAAASTTAHEKKEAHAIGDTAYPAVDVTGNRSFEELMQPQVLLNLWGKLQRRELTLERMRINDVALRRLVAVAVALDPDNNPDNRGHFLRAIESYAERAFDKQSYFKKVLQNLLYKELVDLEAILIQSGPSRVADEAGSSGFSRHIGVGVILPPAGGAPQPEAWVGDHLSEVIKTAKDGQRAAEWAPRLLANTANSILHVDTSIDDAVPQSMQKRLRPDESEHAFETKKTAQQSSEALAGDIKRLLLQRPEQLRRVLRGLKEGGLASIAPHLSSTELRKLVHGFIVLYADSNAAYQHDFPLAIDAHAQRAVDQKMFFQTILEQLLQQQAIDLEAVLQLCRQAADKLIAPIDSSYEAVASSLTLEEQTLPATRDAEHGRLVTAGAASPEELRQPHALLDLWCKLQHGERTLEHISMSDNALRRLIAVAVAMDPNNSADNRGRFLRAIESYAERALDKQTFYKTVLQNLLFKELVDLEAILAQSHRARGAEETGLPDPSRQSDLDAILSFADGASQPEASVSYDEFLSSLHRHFELDSMPEPGGGAKQAQPAPEDFPMQIAASLPREPEQLRRVFRGLKEGGLASVAPHLSSAELRKLVHGYIVLYANSNAAYQHDFPLAIDAHAQRAVDQKMFFQTILEQLLQQQAINLEAVLQLCRQAVDKQIAPIDSSYNAAKAGLTPEKQTLPATRDAEHGRVAAAGATSPEEPQQPQALLELWSKLQHGERTLEHISISDNALRRLIAVAVAMDPNNNADNRGRFLRAIESYAERALDKQTFYKTVLQNLLFKELVDLEAILAQSHRARGAEEADLSDPSRRSDLDAILLFADGASQPEASVSYDEFLSSLHRHLELDSMPEPGGDAKQAQPAPEDFPMQTAAPLPREQEQLRRVFRGLKEGGLASVAPHLGGAELRKLVHGYIVLYANSNAAYQHDFPLAIDAHAQRAVNQKMFFQTILEQLLQQQAIDLEAIVVQDHKLAVAEEVGLDSPSQSGLGAILSSADDATLPEVAAVDLGPSLSPPRRYIEAVNIPKPEVFATPAQQVQENATMSITPPLSQRDAGKQAIFSPAAAGSTIPAVDVIDAGQIVERSFILALRRQLSPSMAVASGDAADGRSTDDFAAMVDALALTQPEQLRQVYHDLRNGKLSLKKTSISILKRLVAAFISLETAQKVRNRRDFLHAIEINAKNAGDQENYFRLILEALVHRQLIDLDAIIGRSSALSVGQTATVDQHAGVLNAVSSSDALNVAQPDTIAEMPIIAEWERAVAATNSVALRKLTDRIITGGASALRLGLLGALRNVQFMTRFVELLPENHLTRILRQLIGSEYADVRRYTDIVGDAVCFLSADLTQQRVAILKWQSVFKYFFISHTPFSREIFISTLSSELMRASGVIHAQALHELVAHQIASSVPVNGAPSAMNEAKKPAPTRSNAALSSDLPTTGQLPTKHRDQNKNMDEEQLKSDIHVDNAGQILASPYLPRLFTLLNLMERNAFVDPKAAERAVHLLQFMVNGQTESPEYQLVLNKQLCGVRTGVPIARGITITDHEKQVVEELIQGMVQNWSAIGKTSVEGFRQSFLQRQGWLSIQDDAWQMRVQEKAFDMLLDHLPWNISTIMHPWMVRPIYVKWR